MDYVDKNCDRFRMLTGMLPPGKDEAQAAIGQFQFRREEVRNLCWKVFATLDRENERLCTLNMAKEFSVAIAEWVEENDLDTSPAMDCELADILSAKVRQAAEKEN